MTETTPEATEQETPKLPTFTLEELSQGVLNLANEIVGLKLVVSQLATATHGLAQTDKAHKDAIIKTSKEVNRVAEELVSQDARIVVMRSWLKSLGPEPTPLTGVEND